MRAHLKNFISYNSSMSAVDLSGYVLVPLERLRALEVLEADIPNIIAKAKIDRDKEKLEALHAARRADPAKFSKKVLERYHRNKEEINARRREAYRLKKEASTKTNEPTA